MDREALLALIDARSADDGAFAALVSARKDADIADSLSAGRTRIVSRMITERGVVAALGVVDGETFLEGIEAFAAATLPDAHPLKPAHAGIKRMLGWLKTDAGLDIGSTEAHGLLDALGAAGVLSAPGVAAIKALSTQPDPIRAADVSDALNWRRDEVIV